MAQSENGKIHIWDCPGVNEHFSLFDPEDLSYYYCADRIFILYCDSPKVIKEIIMVIFKIKPTETYLVRTKCDTYESGHSKTIQQEIETDRDLIAKWGVKLPILATSSKKDLSFQDNGKIKRLLTGVE